MKDANVKAAIAAVSEPYRDFFFLNQFVITVKSTVKTEQIVISVVVLCDERILYVVREVYTFLTIFFFLCKRCPV